MNDKLIIRKPNNDELPLLVEIEARNADMFYKWARENGKEKFQFTETNLLDEIKQNNVFVAVQDEEIVGFIAFEKFISEKFIFILEVDVDPKSHGKKIGKALIKHVINLL